MESRFLSVLKKYDLSFFGTTFAIFIIGIFNLYSATHAATRNELDEIFKIQIVWYCFSLAIGVMVSFIRPKNIFRYSYFIYGLNIFLLILVLVVGTKVMGATRWLSVGPFRIQPSEMMKISVVLALARWLSKSSPEKNLGLKDLLVPSIIAFFPGILIIIEPDLGTGLLIILIFSVIIFYRNLQWKVIGILFILGIIGGSIMYQFGLKDYQRQRIVTFLDPWGDARGSGYNAIQSEIAIGSGLLLGKGFKKSSQASLSYLPENHTDFVFSVYNEEHGLFGSVVLLILYLILMMRFIWLSGSVLNFYDSIVAIGVMSIFFWHTFINMGMVTGLMPIVGLPLPYMSYGGSSLLTFGICCGLATSISNSRNIF